MEEEESLVGNERIFLFGVGARATAGERWPLRTGIPQEISQLCEAGKVETDKWPLELVARLSGQATSVPRVRRGRKSFDGYRF